MASTVAHKVIASMHNAFAVVHKRFARLHKAFTNTYRGVAGVRNALPAETNLPA